MALLLFVFIVLAERELTLKQNIFSVVVIPVVCFFLHAQHYYFGTAWKLLLDFGLPLSLSMT